MKIAVISGNIGERSGQVVGAGHDVVYGVRSWRARYGAEPSARSCSSRSRARRRGS